MRKMMRWIYLLFTWPFQFYLFYQSKKIHRELDYQHTVLLLAAHGYYCSKKMYRQLQRLKADYKKNGNLKKFKWLFDRQFYEHIKENENYDADI